MELLNSNSIYKHTGFLLIFQIEGVVALKQILIGDIQFIPTLLLQLVKIFLSFLGPSSYLWMGQIAMIFAISDDYDFFKKV